MSRTDCIKEIVRASERYYRAFALAEHMQHHQDSLEWISPKPGFQGPSLVYGVNLTRPAALQIEYLLPALQENLLPHLWVLHPLCTPKRMSAILSEKGFACLSDNLKPEYGMFLSLRGHTVPTAQASQTTVVAVEDPDLFRIWMHVVNTNLHGWELLTPAAYSRWLRQPGFRFYLGFVDGVPAATAAVFQEGDSASLEFVSTLEAYRHRGASYTLCRQALLDLQAWGVQQVTLRASFEAAPLYKHLGFRPCYAQQLYQFQPE